MPNGAVRILMYSHDTYGLGHITRTLRIARAIRDASKHASVLILTGSPVAPYMPLPEGADFVKLPSVVKAGPDLYRSRDLEISFQRIKRIRRDLIRGTCETFRPHLFLVDNVPLGMKSEILPTLRYLRAESPSTRIVLDLRDILDDPMTIDAAWERDGVRPVLDEFYDRIIVLGDPSFFDAQKGYRLPAEKTVHVGYAAPGGTPVSRDPACETVAKHKTQKGHSRRRILVTAGGGGDGVEFLRSTLAGLELLMETVAADGGPRIGIEVVTGPLMDPEERSRTKEAASALGAEVREFVPDLPRRMSRADLVIAMSGYNTCCEILSCARAALLFPRVTPRVEQLIRAQVLRDHGLVRMLPPQERSAARIAEAALQLLSDGPVITHGRLPAMDGLAGHAREIGELVLAGAGHAKHRSPTVSPKRERGDGDIRLGLGSRDGRAPASPAKQYWYWPGISASLSRARLSALRRKEG